ncbi:MAG TPA: hypothetical protein VFS42_00550 [Burkholderiaceae bacterium]|nr:hypothetical protein [Burkholderiaceae bacterium]
MNDVVHPRELFSRAPVIGPAYAAVFKATATLIVIAILYYGIRAFERTNVDASLQLMLGFGLIGVAVLMSYWALMRSTTTIDAKGISQTLMFKRPVAWDDIRSVRLVRLPTAARLFVRTNGPRVAVFHAGSQELAQAFAAVARRYPPY